MTASALDFPQARTAPAHVIDGLRAVDPSAALVYLGDGRWLLGSVRPSAIRRAQAASIIQNALDTFDRTGARTGAKGDPHADPRTRDRLALGLLAYQGFSPIAEYTIAGEPDSAIVHDLARRDWLYRTLSDQAVEASWTADQDAAAAEARADLADEARARDAWRYAFTRSHLVQHGPAIAASGRTTHRIAP